ncbi:MAG: bifunctional phosphopantothenoylcysteine decarboxylase/phosphopantothenate--cysteine ligase CoaBC [Pseudomonadota bacterium]
METQGTRVLLIVGGGIAAYKCLELVRRLGDAGVTVRVVLTEAATHFVTPLSFGALSGEKVFTSLFDLDDEREIGHINLARQTDLVIVAPATAGLIAKMANGLTDDLATAALLATNAPVLIAPAMNPAMWNHPATQRNVSQLAADGIAMIGPEVGEMAEKNEAGRGRMAEPHAIRDRALDMLTGRAAATKAAMPDRSPETLPNAIRAPLMGKRVLVTSGPTHEPIDPVRYIANRSSGKQGMALAIAARDGGADVTLVTGPTRLPDPDGIKVQHVQTAAEMLDAVTAALPTDVGIFAAAVADWRVVSAADQKLKKGDDGAPPQLVLEPNPDILRTVAQLAPQHRPPLVVGFAAETENLIAHAQAKLARKGCDIIVANDVGGGEDGAGVMGKSRTQVALISAHGVDRWPDMSKAQVAEKLMGHCAALLEDLS